jgi:HKD family nuclease
MKAEVDFLFLPYDTRQSLSDLLADELESGEWDQFLLAVAFAKNSLMGHSRLLRALREFVRNDGDLTATIGADVFAGGQAKGSDYDAVKELLSTCEESESAELYLYHEKAKERRTFHPKLYLFSNEDEERALLILGSSNLSDGGLRNNVEANASIHLDLAEETHREKYDRNRSIFSDYWTEAE